MKPDLFRLKPLHELNADDFERAPLWAGYYEPEDVEEIALWGVPSTVVRAALDAVDWQDDHYFPLPPKAASTSWTRGKLFAATVVTPGGIHLAGYVGETHDYVVAFLNGQRFVLSEQTSAESNRLQEELGAPEVVPLQIVNRVTGATWVYPET